jgi:hypothetical protein
MSIDNHERARLQILDIDERRINRMVWRKHPVFAIRFAMASRFTVDGFWVPIGKYLAQGMGYGGFPWLPSCATQAGTSRSRTSPATGRDTRRRPSVRAPDHTILHAPRA